MIQLIYNTLIYKNNTFFNLNHNFEYCKILPSQTLLSIKISCLHITRRHVSKNDEKRFLMLKTVATLEASKVYNECRLALLLSIKIELLYGFYILHKELYFYTIHKHRRKIDMTRIEKYF